MSVTVGKQVSTCREVRRHLHEADGGIGWVRCRVLLAYSVNETLYGKATHVAAQHSHVSDLRNHPALVQHVWGDMCSEAKSHLINELHHDPSGHRVVQPGLARHPPDKVLHLLNGGVIQRILRITAPPTALVRCSPHWRVLGSLRITLG